MKQTFLIIEVNFKLYIVLKIQKFLKFCNYVAQQIHTSSKYEIDNNIDNNRSSSYYDSSSGMILNLGQDRDTGDYKYQRRPLFEWLNRWLK
jgi:hypothetical protein